MTEAARLKKTMDLLNAHLVAFQAAQPFAAETGHTTPSDTKSWSQILVSVLTGITGRARKKGSDLDDGSDVKAANLWDAIDTPRFNGAIPAGRTSKASAKPEEISALDGMPFLFFVLWDKSEKSNQLRCRVWCVRPEHDSAFRTMCAGWYKGRRDGSIVSTNFQLHPPRNKDSNIIRNSFGNLEYPLLLDARWNGKTFEVYSSDFSVMTAGMCRAAPQPPSPHEG